MKVKLSVTSDNLVIDVPCFDTLNKTKEEIIEHVIDQYVPSYLKLHTRIKIGLLNNAGDEQWIESVKTEL